MGVCYRTIIALFVLPIINITCYFLPSNLLPSRTTLKPHPRHPSCASLHLFQNGDDRDEAEIVEEARVKVLLERRNQIRSTLKAAESIRNFRLRSGIVPELDEEGKPIKSDGKVAVSLTAFCVAAGAIVLRVGGRAALISAVGLDFMADNPDLKNNLDNILAVSDSMDPTQKVVLFTAAWTAVKLSCIDAGGVALALSAGVLFGGVFQGAIASAAAATFGSSIAFSLAKMETPARKKALEVLEEYPALRGIEKVVAKDGLKAILTLRLCPILPIPIGLYNYIYGVTNVPILDFCGGIFLGSLKPYLLDSYLGYFGKSLIDGTAGDGTGIQDVLLLVALGVSVLIGVFASQLATETWDSVLEEVESEESDGKEDDDGITREVFGFQLPDWMVGFQFSYKEAEERVRDVIVMERQAKVWNYTKEEGGPPPAEDPARLPSSPEIVGRNQGIDFSASLCDGLALSPLLFENFLKYADPLYNEEDDEMEINRIKRLKAVSTQNLTVTTASLDDVDFSKPILLQRLNSLRSKTQQRLELLDERLSQD